MALLQPLNEVNYLFIFIENDPAHSGHDKQKIGLNALVDVDYMALISHITPFDPQNKNYLKKHSAQIHCTHHMLCKFHFNSFIGYK
jgi:hypothetical protein